MNASLTTLAVVVAGAGVLSVSASAPASAQIPTPAPQTFTYQGAVAQTVRVPAGETGFTVSLQGGKGGTATRRGGTTEGGYGRQVRGHVSVRPGDLVSMKVANGGGNGNGNDAPGDGGWGANSGGAGGHGYGESGDGGGGGGSSALWIGDVQSLTPSCTNSIGLPQQCAPDRLVATAAGGGGAGGIGFGLNSNSPGGFGGSADQDLGINANRGGDGADCFGGSCAGGATYYSYNSNGRTAGDGQHGYEIGYGSGANATTGGGGGGGGAGAPTWDNWMGGAGTSGEIAGGGSMGGAGGGGAGSSRITSRLTAVSSSRGDYSSSAAGRITLTWDAPVYQTVSFNSGGAQTITPQTVPVGGAASAPSATRAGWALRGWYSAATGGTKWDFTQPVTNDMTLYAQWDTAVTLQSNYDFATTSITPTALHYPRSITLTATMPAGVGGTVDFYDMANVLATVPVVNGTASLTVAASTLAAGTNYLAASYSGDPATSATAAGSDPIIVTRVSLVSLAKVGTPSAEILEVPNQSTASGVKVDTWTPAMVGWVGGQQVTSDHQLWFLRPENPDTGYMQIVNAHSGKCLEINGTDGGIDQWDCHTTDANHYWRQVPVPGTPSTVSGLQSKLNGRYLTSNGSLARNVTDGTQLSVTTTTSDLSTWTITPQP